MGLKFYFGPSGSGKTTKACNDIIELSKENPIMNFYVIVPDQATMAMQKTLTEMCGGGIMNIDVLSLGRLSGRIIEEVGGDMPVIDDTGKNLILRKVVGKLSEKLPYLGKKLGRNGYIQEVKSVISEFMEYGYSPEDVEEMSVVYKSRGTLSVKLHEISLIYEGFLEFLKDKFTTREESMEQLSRLLYKSDKVKGSIVLFDGFTGFTPVQELVIRSLLEICKQVCITVTVDSNDNPYKTSQMQDLFWLSKETVNRLCKLQETVGAAKDDDVYLNEVPVYRYKGNEELSFLERNLFRFGRRSYKGHCKAIEIARLDSPRLEALYIAKQIKKLVTEEGYSYRDIAIVSGDIETYGDIITEAFREFDLPVYIDRNRGITLNPLTEYIRGGLKVIISNFSYQSVFHFLKSGLTPITRDETDILENYVRAVGIRGKKAYFNEFTMHASYFTDEGNDLLLLNGIREKIVSLFGAFYDNRPESMKDKILCLYNFIQAADAENKLFMYAEEFDERRDFARGKEYAGVYRIVMQILERMNDLLGDELVSYEEFYEILDAGFLEIKAGSIPQDVDRIVCGDIERTRLDKIRVLFFAGINDGIIPKAGKGGGLISEFDKEFLNENGKKLSRTGREEMFIQRFYLYLNITKPTDSIRFSYAGVGNDGKSLRPAYLIASLMGMFPGITVQNPGIGLIEEIDSEKEARRIFAGLIGKYAREEIVDDRVLSEIKSIHSLLNKDLTNAHYLGRILNTAFGGNGDAIIGRDKAKALYGEVLQNSVSRLEVFATCEYRHFLRYGMKLSERENYEISSTELGLAYHGILELYSRKLKDEGLSWFTVSDEERKRILSEAVSDYLEDEDGSIFFYSNTNRFEIVKLTEIMEKSIESLTYQIRKGSFMPSGFEVNFRNLKGIKSRDFYLADSTHVELLGSIDRVDIKEDDSRVYVKIIDYKSSGKDLTAGDVYNGLNLQLPLYMNVAAEYEQNLHKDKEIVKAGMFYYQLESPFAEGSVVLTDDEINALIQKKLRMSGMFLDDPGAYESIDGDLADIGASSDTIPASVKKDGTLKSSSVLSPEEMDILGKYVDKKVRSLSGEIMEGYIRKNPVVKSEEYACTYCPYSEICPFDKGSGNEREIRKMETSEAIECMKEQIYGK